MSKYYPTGKKMKLNLEDLKVQSFVTTLTEDEQNKLKGATGSYCGGTYACSLDCEV